MRFPFVSLDVPAPFKVWGKRPGGTDSRSAEAHYDTMTWPELFALGPSIDSITTRDSIICQWIFPPLVEYQQAMVRAWGTTKRKHDLWGKAPLFDYKTKLLSWVKVGNQFTNALTLLGYYSRANTEDYNLYVRGSVKRMRADVQQILMTLEEMGLEGKSIALLRKPRGHSAKPELAYDMIESLFPGPYLELFARRHRVGWRCLGWELDGLDIRESISRLAKDEPIPERNGRVYSTPARSAGNRKRRAAAGDEPTTMAIPELFGFTAEEGSNAHAATHT